MKILIIGAQGTIGKIITAELAKDHEIVTVGKTSGDWQFDISSAEEVECMFRAVGQIDACICAAGDSETDDLSQLTVQQLQVGITNKLLAQANIVLIGQKYLNDNGSLTLTSGKMGDLPVKGSTGKAFVNGAINSFVMAAALDLQRGLRLNAVSPAKIGSVSDFEIFNAYRKCVESDVNGKVFKIY